MAVVVTRGADGRVTDPLWPCRQIEPIVRAAMEDTDPTAPLVIYVHGHMDWPHPDILAQAKASDGLAIQFLWDGLCSNWAAPFRAAALYRTAGHRAAEFRQLLTLIGEIDPQRKIDIMCHSLGARIGLMALRGLPKTVALSRVVCVSAVEFSAPTLVAVHAMQGRNVDFFNITTEEQPFFHQMMQRFGPQPGPKDLLLSRGFAFPQANWFEIRLDVPAVRNPLSQIGAIKLDLNRPVGPKLAAQFGEAFVYRKKETATEVLRERLGAELPQPLSMVPLRKPPRRHLRRLEPS